MSAATVARSPWDVKKPARKKGIGRGFWTALIIGGLVIVGGLGLVQSAQAAERDTVTPVSELTQSLADQADAIGAEYEQTCGGPQVAAAEAASGGDTTALASLDDIQGTCQALGEKHAGFVDAVTEFTGWVTETAGAVGVTVTDSVRALVGDHDIEGAVTEMYEGEAAE
jgi:hypothetical protein